MPTTCGLSALSVDSLDRHWLVLWSQIPSRVPRVSQPKLSQRGKVQCPGMQVSHILVAVALAARLAAVDVAVVDAVRVAVAALAADERVVAVGLGLAAVALVALHT